MGEWYRDIWQCLFCAYLCAGAVVPGYPAIHQIDLLGEHQQVYIAPKSCIVGARPEQINLRLRISLTDGATDGLMFFVGYTQACSLWQTF